MAITPCTIRLARREDLGRINDIYNHYVLASTCTYQEEPDTVAERETWFERHDMQHPVTVAEVGGRIVGWGSLSSFHPRSAYRFSVENSVYVDPEHHRQGIGSALLRDLLERSRLIGHRTIVALIDADQEGSVALHARFGFEHAALLKQVGFKFDRWLDVVYMQLML